MNRYDQFLAHVKIRRSCVLLFLIVLLWLVRSVMSTVLLTFIFSFLVIRLINFVRRRFPVKPVVIVGPLYLLIVAALGYAILHYVPLIADQTVSLTDSLVHFYNHTQLPDDASTRWLLHSFDRLNLNTQIQTGMATILKYAGSITAMGMAFVISLLLSFFYSIEIDELTAFGQNFLNSSFGWFFADIQYFATKFINTFGVVIEAQLFIALVNTAITTLTLLVMGMPSIPALAVMVFLLSLIPVAGALISVAPLAMVAYTVDGWQGIVTIVIMIAVIHILEAYVLNPKFMSSRTKLPIFFTFVVLLGGEKLFGTWGLIVGLPVFTFFLDILGVKKIAVPTPTKKLSH